MSPTVSGINAGFNGFEFARERRRLEGHLDASNVPLSAFERLRETGAEIEDLAYSIQGGTNDFGRPMLELGVRGRVRMQCQRCLEPVVVPIDAIVPLELRRTIEEIESADDDVDRVLATDAMDVNALVEDELLLALPMVPRHEDCTPQTPAAAAKDGRASPFAVLARNIGKIEDTKES